MEIRWAQNMRKVIIGMAGVESCDQVGKCAAAPVVTKRTERTGTGEVERRRGIRGVRRRQRGGETEDGFILCFEGLFNVPVQFAIGSSSLRYVEIASSSYIAVRGIEGEGTCDVLKLGKRDVLYKQC